MCKSIYWILQLPWVTGPFRRPMVCLGPSFPLNDLGRYHFPLHLWYINFQLTFYHIHFSWNFWCACVVLANFLFKCCSAECLNYLCFLFFHFLPFAFFSYFLLFRMKLYIKSCSRYEINIITIVWEVYHCKMIPQSKQE